MLVTLHLQVKSCAKLRCAIVLVAVSVEIRLTELDLD